MNLHTSTLKIASLVFLIALTFQSCKKKKDDTVSLPITGTWESLTDTTYKYLVFKDDNTVTALRQGAYGIHTASINPFTADGEQLISSLSGGSSQLFNYRVSNDTLYLENVGAYLVFKKNNGVTTDGWTKKVTTLATHPLGSGAWFGALEWDGSSFLISSSFAHKVYKVSPASFAVTDSVAVSQKGSGIAYLSGSTWLNDYGVDKKLHTVDISTGATTFDGSACTETPLMLATQGSNILVFTNGPSLYEYNTGGNSFTLLQNLPGFGLTGGGIPPDMVVKDGYAYLAAGPYILKFDLSTYQVVDTYLSDTQLQIGIAYDGTDFYTLGISLDGGLSDLNVTIRKVQLQ
jgi:hypothetical protein